MINYNTKNYYFLNFCQSLIDIKNYNYILTLIDESLKDFDLSMIDINNPNRDSVMKKVKDECKNNIWFFFREILIIPSPVEDKKTGYSKTPNFIVNTTNIEMIHMYKNDSSFQCMTYRSCGKTITLLCLFLYEDFILGNDNLLPILIGGGRSKITLLNKILDANFNFFMNLSNDNVDISKRLITTWDHFLHYDKRKVSNVFISEMQDDEIMSDVDCQCMIYIINRDFNFYREESYNSHGVAKTDRSSLYLLYINGCFQNRKADSTEKKPYMIN